MLKTFVKRPASTLRRFLRTESAGGILLMAAAALGLLAANSPLATAYAHLVHFDTGITLSPQIGSMSVEAWVNDAAMSIFFLLVGLEIKREFTDGELASWADRRLPMIAALGGMIVPAAVFAAMVWHDPALLRGWAIPAATDIAFAIGILALLGKRAPASLKLLLTTIAIVDDVGAILIIAIFYTVSINIAAVVAAVLAWLACWGLNRRNVTQLTPYLLLGLLLWYAVLLSGVHATIAGILLAFAIPYVRSAGTPDSLESPLHRLENLLHAPVAYVIIPLFGFANSGVALGSANALLATLPVAIMTGLFIGKQAGVFGSIWLAVRLGVARKPHAGWMQIYGMSLLCGVGFTMSLFIGGLAFAHPPETDGVKIGVLVGSAVSAIIATLILRFRSNAVAPHS